MRGDEKMEKGGGGRRNTAVLKMADAQVICSEEQA